MGWRRTLGISQPRTVRGFMRRAGAPFPTLRSVLFGKRPRSPPGSVSYGVGMPVDPSPDPVKRVNLKSPRGVLLILGAVGLTWFCVRAVQVRLRQSPRVEQPTVQPAAAPLPWDPANERKPIEPPKPGATPSAPPRHHRRR